MSFDTLGLSAGILRAVADEGYSIPTPAQSQAIPAILQGRHVMVRAQTGTGKTAPSLRHLEEPDWWVLQLVSGATIDGKPGRQSLDVVVVGKAAE